MIHAASRSAQPVLREPWRLSWGRSRREGPGERAQHLCLAPQAPGEMLGPRPGSRAATQTKPTARKLEGLAHSVLGAQSALLAAGAWGGAEVGATGSTAPLTLILAPLRNGPENPTPWTGMLGIRIGAVGLRTLKIFLEFPGQKRTLE